jgi:hypothetical protein
MDEAKGLNPYFEGQFDGESAEVVALRLALVKERDELRAGKLHETLKWAVERWYLEVASRPLVNTHRRTLDDAWRQVIRHAGGDPEALIGPAHDALLAARGLAVGAA